MKMSSIDYHMIDRYLDDAMSPEERNAFEEQMQTDETLKKEVELYKEVNDSLQVRLHPDEGEQGLRKTLEQMQGQFFSKQTDSSDRKAKVVSINQPKRWLAIAASVVLLISAGLLFWAPWKKDLYNQYAYTDMPAVSERGEPADSLLKLATIKFNDKRFSESVPLFESIIRVDSANAYVRYYYAIALLHTGKTEQARNELNQLYNGESTFKYDAAFYIALSYLREKDKASTKEWLEKIPADASIYTRARKLLEKL
jgi:tetratricopeptide (TPR) repeat protein